jgi:hypothetical protein
MKQNPDSSVFLSRDEEGNGFTPILTLSSCLSTALHDGSEIAVHTEAEWNPNEIQDPNQALIIWPG